MDAKLLPATGHAEYRELTGSDVDAVSGGLQMTLPGVSIHVGSQGSYTYKFWRGKPGTVWNDGL